MNRQAQAAVLFLTGGAILHAGLTDLYLRYVKAGLRPLLLAAGVVLIATAVATVWYERQGRGSGTREAAEGHEPEHGEAAERLDGAERLEGVQRHEEAERDEGLGRLEGSGHIKRPAAGGAGRLDGSEYLKRPAAGGGERLEGPEHLDGHAAGGAERLESSEYFEGHADGGHAHAHREPRISWLLVLPILALILVAPPALGSYSAMRTGTALQEQPWGFADLPAGDPVRLSLVDYAGRAAYDDGRSLSDRRIRITGFLALDRGGTPYLVRMALSCCAADAQPVKIGLTGRIPPVLRPDAWVEVTGTYTTKQTKDPVNDGIIPFLDVTRVAPVKAPRDTYDESWNG